MDYMISSSCPICHSSDMHIERVTQPGYPPYTECWCNTCSADFEVTYATPDGLEARFSEFVDENDVVSRMQELAKIAYEPF